MKGQTGNATIDACDMISFAADNVTGVANVLMVLADRMETPYEECTLNMLADELMHNATSMRESTEALMTACRDTERTCAEVQK